MNFLLWATSNISLDADYQRDILDQHMRLKVIRFVIIFYQHAVWHGVYSSRRLTKDIASSVGASLDSEVLVEIEKRIARLHE